MVLTGTAFGYAVIAARIPPRWTGVGVVLGRCLRRTTLRRGP